MSLSGTVWVPVGPSPMTEGSAQDNGLVSVIAINPNNPNVLYIGTAGGGVWRSRNAGTTWTPLFDRQAILGIGEPGGVAIDPNNTDVVYVGTSQRLLLGDVNPTFFNTPDPAPGMYKSVDAGNSWIRLGSGFPASNTGNALATFLNNDINVIIVDPSNSSTLYCASSNGIYVSADGGQNWTFGTNSGGDARSLVLDTSSPPAARILYAGITGNGAYTSTDGGLTWTTILTAATPAVSAAIVLPLLGFAKVIVALPPPTSPPNAGGVQVIYVTLEGVGNPGARDPIGVFLSTNQGATWTQRTATGMPLRSQGGYSFHMAIDPASPGDGAHDIIYFGTVSQARSADSGATFTTTSVLHADTHAWAFYPQPSSPSTVYCGTDGGICVSRNNGASWTGLDGGGMQTGLFYNVDVKPDATASVLVGAMQDNAIETTAGATAPDWIDTSGGDGWDVAFDGGIAGQVYSSSGFYSSPCTQVYSSTNDGASFPNNITPWGTTSDGGCYLAPIATDPSNAGTVYVSGSQNLWQSKNSGGTWRIIGSFAGFGDTAVAPANGNNVVIAVGAQVFVCTNALASSGVAFTNITRNLPGRSVTRARFDPIDPTVIYCVLGGFNGAGPGQAGHVFRTSVGATAWTDISPTVGTLKEQVDVPFNALVLDGSDIPTTIYAGTDLGVLRSMDVGQSWSILDDLHFPRVQVSDLVLNTTAGVLVAATYGRGVFKFTTPTGPSIAVELQDNLAFGTVCSGPQYLTLTVENVGVADLVIFNVQRLMGSADFTVLATPATPLILGAGDEIAFTIRFTPSVVGVSETAIIRITSNDPDAPVVDVAATGRKGAGRVATVIANSGSFGDVCVGSVRDKPLLINNTGPCPLRIFSITCAPAVFEAPGVTSYPLVVAPGDSIAVPIRFLPAAFGMSFGTVTIFSSDPASPHTVAVSGLAPPGKLAVSGSSTFGGVKCCRREQRRLSICNVGLCALHVTHVAFKRRHKYFRLLHNPFPAILHPGSCLDVVIQYHAAERVARACELEITSNDPEHPVHCVEVIAWTIWECCEEARCECCKKSRCDCECSRKCCDDDDDRDHEHEHDHREADEE